MELSYRHSAYENSNLVITAASVRLAPADRNEIKSTMNDILARRKEKQPLEYPSAGSTFKRPEGNFAGALIEQCGLKGVSVGGAQVSEARGLYNQSRQRYRGGYFKPYKARSGACQGSDGRIA